MENVTIAHVSERQRYEISVDGDPIGLSRYRDDNGQRVFLHTEIDSKFQGRGFATELIRWSLKDTREAGLRIVASCPMVSAFVTKRREFDDIVDRTDVPPA